MVIFISANRVIASHYYLQRRKFSKDFEFSLEKNKKKKLVFVEIYLVFIHWNIFFNFHFLGN